MADDPERGTAADRDDRAGPRSVDSCRATDAGRRAGLGRHLGGRVSRGARDAPVAQDLVTYNFLRRYHPDVVERALWGDKALFVLLSAGGIGIVAVVLWDTLFPGRRDVFVLGTLPVRREVQAAGRLGGLIALFVLFAVALNAIPTMLFPIGAGSGLVSIVRTTIGHVVSVLAADAFVFFGLTAFQGVLLVIAPRRVAERLAPIIQRRPRSSCC